MTYIKFSDKLHISKSEGISRYLFFCPGCEETHSFPVRTGPGQPEVKCWQFNGDPLVPTFTPSLVMPFPSSHRCHLELTNGKIHYAEDCAHHLAGEVVDMVDMEQW